MKKRMISILLAGIIAASLAACGSSGGAGSTKPAETTGAAGDEASEGKVLNIQCWNDEFARRMRDHMPGYEAADKDDATKGGKIGDVQVTFTVTPSTDNAYQNNLDAILPENMEEAADDRVDLFLVEADYALKYVNTPVALPISDLGITEEELANQYQYTKDIVTDADGNLKGLTWQGCPGVLIYNRDIAKEVLGSDDPEEVQKAVADWDTFNKTAAALKEKGYRITSTVNDSYRVFSNNVSAPFVEDGKTINIDPNIMNWVDQTKEYTDKGYNNKTSLWDESWAKDQGPKGDVFGFFYSTWGINFTLAGNSLETPEAEGGKLEEGNGIYGDYAVCQGPASWYWGGTWICGAAGTDNPTLVADVMRKLTCDKDIMKQITLDTQDYTNNQAAMTEIAEDPDFGSDFLGGQNHIALFVEAAPLIDMSNAGPYDQGINEGMQTAFKDYFEGTVDEDKAKANFETAIKEKYPELETVNWPE